MIHGDSRVLWNDFRPISHCIFLQWKRKIFNKCVKTQATETYVLCKTNLWSSAHYLAFHCKSFCKHESPQKVQWLNSECCNSSIPAKCNKADFCRTLVLLHFATFLSAVLQSKVKSHRFTWMVSPMSPGSHVVRLPNTINTSLLACVGMCLQNDNDFVGKSRKIFFFFFSEKKCWEQKLWITLRSAWPNGAHFEVMVLLDKLDSWDPEELRCVVLDFLKFVSFNEF